MRREPGDFEWAAIKPMLPNKPATCCASTPAMTRRLSTWRASPIATFCTMRSQCLTIVTTACAFY